MTQIFQPLLLQSMGLPWRLWRIFSPNGTVVALCKSLTMVMMLIPLISSWRCLYSSLSMLMDNRPLQLPHIIWRKRNNLKWLETAFIEKALIKGTKGLDPLDPFTSTDTLSEEVDSIDFTVTLDTEIDSFFYPRMMMMIIRKMMTMINGSTKMKNP